MEIGDNYFQHPTTSRSRPSNSFATVDPADLNRVPPTSPSLEPSSSRVTRRRSWGNRKGIAATSESERSHLELDMPASPRKLPTRLALPEADSEYLLADDPWRGTDANNYSQSTGVTKDVYVYSQPSPSTTVLMRSPGASMHTDSEVYDSFHEDSGATHLTSNASRIARQDSLDTHSNSDPEHDGATPPRSHRKSSHFPLSPSPLKSTGDVMKSVSKNLRRISLRVVNLRNSGLEGQVRLEDGEDERTRVLSEEHEGAQPDVQQSFPIRGRALGFLGTDSKIRLSLFKFLVHPMTEPFILILIILNAVILTMESFPALTLPSANGPTLPPTVKGYFHTWKDYVLFALFIVFTVEALARICATGFLFDPEVSMFSLFSANTTSSDTLNGTASSLVRRTSLSRGRSFKQRLKRFWKNLMRPFALSGQHSSSPYVAPSTYSMSSLPRPGFPNKLSSSSISPFGSRADPIQRIRADIHRHPDPTIALRTENISEPISLPFRLSVDQIYDKTHRNVPYLRQSWTRIDFIAVVSFWITFGLAMAGVERGVYHIGIFRALSVLRTGRLLTITSGTTTIMHSLKIARPLIARVAYFVLFAMVLFSIIGVQSFKGSLRRTCVITPTLGEDIHTTSQFCGGHLDPITLSPIGYTQINNQTYFPPKGYICPLGQVCVEADNPNQGLQSFDTIYSSALQVVIVAGANNWSQVMYSVIDSDFFISCLYFIICIVVLNFWIINLFVAVITNTFAAIRSETRKSAFGATPTISPFDKDKDDGWAMVEGLKAVRSNVAKNVYGYTKWLWLVLALAELVLQATRTVDISPMHGMVLFYGELVITVAFDIEIVLRILASLPDWRAFFRQGQNWFDTFLAIGATVIQLPVIRNSPFYAWFTVLQLMRFYRVVLVVPRMKPLLLSVFGNMYGIANMVLFLIIVNYISALMAVQLLRGDFGNDHFPNYGEVYNSFLNIYQVTTSENWTDVLYGAAIPEIPLRQAIIVLLFFTAWFLFGNFIILQMFIAVINENFQVAEEQKKGKQASNYYNQQKARQGNVSWFRRFNPYRWIKANPETAKVSNLPANLILPIQKTLVQDYNLSRSDSRAKSSKKSAPKSRFFKPQHYSSKSVTALQQLFVGDSVRTNNTITLSSFRHHPTQEASTDPIDEEIERHLEILASVEQDTGHEAEDEYHERRAQKADFIRNHPSYDRVFWFIGQKNPLRQLCQRVVQPARGDRIFGIPPSPVAHSIFQLAILFTVIGGIVVESIATPMYRRVYFQKHGLSRGAWFEIAETAFGFALFVEFVIKVIADGFIFTPNGYLFSIWNCLDFFIMIGIIVNITTGLIFVGGLSRLTRSLKALRALRLITLVDRMRNTFGTLIIYGAVQIFDAAVLAFLYMVPYAVWGLNIFNGKLNSCNDSGVGGVGDCVGEYVNTVYDNAFGFPVPRVWTYPSPSTTFNFDSFRASLLILFEIVSLEGWVDVMRAACSITGPNQQPHVYASPSNAIFFVIYNLLGGIVILTIFVSLIIGNFRTKTGADLLTRAQREWIDLQKLIRRQKSSKRPLVRPTGRFRKWCFDRAVHKHGLWWIMMTVLFVLHIIALMTQTFSINSFAESFRNDLFLAIMAIYIIDVFVRCYGLGWRSFKANGWNIFDIIVSIGSFVTTLAVRFGNGGFGSQQLQKLFLVSIAFKLVERTNSLNMLFKTAISSLPSILSLLCLWIVLFIFFAILYVEVFGLTKWGANENHLINYYSMGSALLMLSSHSVGENWNQFMHDFDLTYPHCTSHPVNDTESDCGSGAWSYSLFISWNLLSMYIFVNMFVGVVVENFSYVFQASGSSSKSISREQMRSFKKIWAEYSNPKTGYLERPRFAAFFSKLSGVFEIRIYPVEFGIHNLVSACKVVNSEVNPLGLDLDKLRLILNDMDAKEIRKRRATYCRLYQEASITHEPGLGISFTNMLLLLAHHKLIVDAEALILQDLVARTETNKLITDLVNLDRVRSLLKTISLRRQFLKWRDMKRAAKFEKEIPSIVVEDMPETPLMSSRDIVSAGLAFSPGSPSRKSKRISQADYSLAIDTSSGSRLQRSGRWSQEYSSYSVDFGNSRPATLDDAQDIVSAMHNTVWGDLMMEVVEEEQGKKGF